MFEPKQDGSHDLDGQRMTREDERPPGDMRSLRPRDLTSLEEVPPTPPPSKEGEDGGGTEASMSEILREDQEEEEGGKISEEKEQQEFFQAYGGVYVGEKQPLIDEENASEAADANAPPSSSSSSFVIPELRLDRSFSADGLSTPGTDEEYDEDDEDEEEEEEEEEDSDDNYLERSDSKRRSLVEASSCEKHTGGLSVQNSLRRRTHSEGSLLQDPRSTSFTSDNAINCLETAGAEKGGWTLPSPKTLKKQLMENGGSVHQLRMLFSGRKSLV